MGIKVITTALPGVLIVVPQIFSDNRGFFLETYQQVSYTKAQIYPLFIQDNHSRSVKHVLRGLHYQLRHPQAKLIYVTGGEIFDIAVDIRRSSPTFGKWVGVTLSEQNHNQLLVPQGFAHGFCVLSNQADVIYKCSELYFPEDDHGIRWDDPDLAISWPIKNPLLSEKDALNPLLSQIPKEALPLWSDKVL